ncbi:MAG: hypothetical protein EYC67_02550 [Betaproteobacteria bacterium]|nr:MAG: hypothetical protein EYC67_02550 [Betaproteobacteria bacterium]
MPSRVSPPLSQYSLEELEALLQAIKSAIAGRLSATEAVRAIAPIPPLPEPLGASLPVVSAPSAVDDYRPPAKTGDATASTAPPDQSAPSSKSGGVEPVPPPPAIRYMHPANRNMAWSGEGVQPEWIDAYLAQGGSWIALQNTAEKLAPRKR